METISLKMDENMLKNIDSCLKDNNYSTRTEFIRDAVRQKLSEFEKKKLLDRIAKMKGSLKGKFKLTDAEAKELATEEYLSEFGIKIK